MDLKVTAFADHLKPMVILALKTGLRRNELFSLEWKDVLFEQNQIVVKGAKAKSGKTRHVPLTKKAFKALKSWHVQNPKKKYVFTSPKTGKCFTDCKKAFKEVLKEADITDFNWHDMRHDFASQLVMKGVDLSTIQDFMGHSDIKMTQRYAHLAPEHKQAAVNTLDELAI